MPKQKNKITIQLNKINALPEGADTVMFSKPVTITDNSVMHSGTKYDIKSLSIDDYKGQITMNHGNDIQDIVGKVVGLVKKGSKVTIDGIKFAVKQNSWAQFARDMLVGGFATDFSIETIGDWPDEDGIFKGHSLVGLSLVIVGNNKSATLNEATDEVFYNSMGKSKSNGLDTSTVESLYSKYRVNSINNDLKDSKKESSELSESKNMPEEKKKDTQPEEEVTPVEGVEEAEETKKSEEKPKEEEVVNEEMNSLRVELNKLKDELFKSQAKEPEFTKSTHLKDNSLASMDYRERHRNQINHAWDFLKNNSEEAGRKLRAINEFHVESLQEAGIVNNQMTIDDFGNFVISPELLSDIEGHRSNFTPLLSRIEFRDTLSLQMAWLSRNGDIDMSEVEMCDDGADGNLKPISEYDATINTSNLHELAAVTPVCNAATRFLAVDLLGDVAAGYKTDYDRKKSQLFMARLQQAVNASGNQVEYDVTSDTTALQSWINTMSEMQEEIMNGVFVFNQKTYAEMLGRALGAGITGPLASLFTTGDQAQIVGTPYIVVPNELMPTLGSSDTKQFTVEGTVVNITNSVFYLDLSTFTGRTSGGLNYDLSTQAAYEVGGETRSAFQRNELVLRGSFFRGGAVKDEDKVVGLTTDETLS